jgi:hypothetical protein
MIGRALRVGSPCLIWLLVAVPASAEIVCFASGQCLSVKGHRFEGLRTVIVLRGGGEIVCEASLIVRIAPDEVPVPEPAAGEGPGASSPPEEAAAYGEMIDRASARHGVDPKLVRAVIQAESAYRPQAVSRKGAMGLMQLMPDTAQRYGVRNPFDPESNIVAGIRHLRSLLDRFDLSVALAAYNAGEAAVERFGGIPPFAETQEYVRRVLSLAR